MRTLYYYFAVIAPVRRSFSEGGRSIEGDESDAAIPGGAKKLVTAPSGRYGIASHGLQLPPSLCKLWRDKRDDEWWGMVLIQVLISRMILFWFSLRPLRA